MIEEIAAEQHLSRTRNTIYLWVHRFEERGLVAYVSEQPGIARKRIQLGEVLLSEGLHWRKVEAWFGERVALSRRNMPDGPIRACWKRLKRDSRETAISTSAHGHAGRWGARSETIRTGSGFGSTGRP